MTFDKQVVEDTLTWFVEQKLSFVAGKEVACDKKLVAYVESVIARQPFLKDLLIVVNITGVIPFTPDLGNMLALLLKLVEVQEEANKTKELEDLFSLSEVKK